MENTFLKEGYEPTKTVGNYFRFEDGENNIRILSSAITGWEYFTTENKPVRSREQFEELPLDIKVGGRIKEFWSFIIWNINVEKVQIMEITQKTIMKAILALIKNSKWGDVKSFDISITKTGENLETTYSVMPNPKSDLSEKATKAYESSDINLEALYEGDDPFEKEIPTVE